MLHPRVTHEVCNIRSAEMLLRIDRASRRPMVHPAVERAFGEPWTVWVRRRWRARRTPR